MNRTTTHLTWDELSSFINYVKDKDIIVSMYAIIASYMGLRVSDVLKLKWEDLQRDMIVMEEKKTGKIRNIPVHEDVVGLAEYLRRGKKGFIFANKKGSVISIQYLNRMIKKRLEESGIKVSGNTSSHLFRKTFGRKVIESGTDKEYDLILLSEVFRHSSPAITKKYLGIKEEEVQSVYMRF